MVMTDARRVFVDTNVLIYANVGSAPLHDLAQKSLQSLWTAGDEIWISRQVIREYTANVTRTQTFMQPMPTVKVIARVKYFEQTFQVADETAAVTEALLNLIDRIPVGGKQVHDANIVATMLANRVTHLLTHNVSDFNRYSHLIELLPLADTI